MVEYSVSGLDRAFSALGHPVRRAMLEQLSNGDCTVSDLVAPFDMSFQAVSKHLLVLEKAGFIHRTVDGRVHHCRLNPEPIQEAHDWLAYYKRYWETQLDNLEEFLDSINRKEKPNG